MRREGEGSFSDILRFYLSLPALPIEMLPFLLLDLGGRNVRRLDFIKIFVKQPT
jgi:hypothetical protein